MKKDISKAIRMITRANNLNLYRDLETQTQNTNLVWNNEYKQMINWLNDSAYTRQIYVEGSGKDMIVKCINGYWLVKTNILGMSHNLFIIKDEQLLKSFRIKNNMSAWDWNDITYKIKQYFGVL